MTYQQLITELKKLDKTQLQCDVTIEDCYDDQCTLLKELRIVDVEHHSLDENHPVLYF